MESILARQVAFVKWSALGFVALAGVMITLPRPVHSDNAADAAWLGERLYADMDDRPSRFQAAMTSCVPLGLDSGRWSMARRCYEALK